MATQTTENIYREIKALREETENLRELIFLILRDPEGEYKEEFIKKILRKSRLKPQRKFVNKTDFLNQIS